MIHVHDVSTASSRWLDLMSCVFAGSSPILHVMHYVMNAPYDLACYDMFAVICDAMKHLLLWFPRTTGEC